MRALSIKQPWAEAILQGVKKVENRTWGTKYRGPLILHAGKTFDKHGMGWLEASQIRYGFGGPKWPGIKPQGEYRMGAFLGVVDIIGCAPPEVRLAQEWDYWRDLEQYGWGIGRVVRFDEPIPGKGALGLFPVPSMVAGYAKMQWNNNQIPAAAR